MQATWVQDMNAATDEWKFIVDGRNTYGYIHNYPGSNDYCWQAVRNEHRISGLAVALCSYMSQYSTNKTLTILVKHQIEPE